ncbi:hypothetical protein MMC31_007442, partial [Peltigera leucophlebia]|nr:hypothetical protein [Peltigera leucophlebia]
MSSTDTSCSANPDPGLYKLKSKATGNVIFLDGKVQSNLISRGDSNDEAKFWQLAHLGKGEYLILSREGTAIRANVPGEALTSWYTPPAQPHSRWVFETVGAAAYGEYLYVVSLSYSNVDNAYKLPSSPTIIPFPPASRTNIFKPLESTALRTTVKSSTSPIAARLMEPKSLAGAN